MRFNMLADVNGKETYLTISAIFIVILVVGMVIQFTLLGINIWQNHQKNIYLKGIYELLQRDAKKENAVQQALPPSGSEGASGRPAQKESCAERAVRAIEEATTPSSNHAGWG